MSFLKPKMAKSSSTSENVNNGLITSTYSPMMSQGVGANNMLSQLLGVQAPGGSVSGGTPQSNGMNFDPNNPVFQGKRGRKMLARLNAAGINGSGGGQGMPQLSQGPAPDGRAGLNNYLQLAGFAPAMRQLSQGVVGQGAAAGLLNSGSTAKALQTRGTELNSQMTNNYLQQLLGLSGQGLQAGGLVANTGQKSTSTSTGGGPSTFGSVASTVGGIASIFSDRRLKHKIKKVGEFADGLGIYIFSYIGQTQRLRGVMADEVATLRPWALGRQMAGYATVNYGAL